MYHSLTFKKYLFETKFNSLQTKYLSPVIYGLREGLGFSVPNFDLKPEGLLNYKVLCGKNVDTYFMWQAVGNLNLLVLI